MSILRRSTLIQNLRKAQQSGISGLFKTKAETEFEKYRIIQDKLFMSDFDKYMLELEENAKK